MNECRAAWLGGSTHGVSVICTKVHCSREGFFCISSQFFFSFFSLLFGLLKNCIQ